MDATTAWARSHDAGIVRQHRVEDHLLDPDAKGRLHLAQGGQATAVGQRDEALLGEVGQRGDRRRLTRPHRADVEQDDLVDLEVVEDAEDVHGIAHVDRVREAHGLHERPAVEQEARDHPRLELQAQIPIHSVSRAIPCRWLFSGWN
jgi:hypothetical protein